jgi:hypothetical protein
LQENKPTCKKKQRKKIFKKNYLIFFQKGSPQKKKKPSILIRFDIGTLWEVGSEDFSFFLSSYLNKLQTM